jgi:hypothetical protein
MKKLLISLFIGLTVFLSFAPYLKPIKAQTWYNQTFQEWYGKVYDPSNPSEIFGERYTAAQVQWIVYGIFGFLVNTATGPQNSALIQCFISNVADATTCIDQLKLLLPSRPLVQTTPIKNISSRENLWSLVFASNRPVSGIGYVKERLEKLSPVSVVRAASVGTGFNALKPVQGMWTAFRNVSFGLFVIVAVIFAFMIMFRVKLSPQTVVSVQSALPKIVISLVLVTFSYAIAGFLIDLMYVVIGLVSLIGSQIINGAGGNSSATIWFKLLTLGQPAGFNIQLGVFGLLAVYLMVFCLALLFLLVLNVGILGTAVSGVLIGFVLVASGLLPILLIVAVIAAIIMFIIVLWIMLKIIWGLLKAFANVLLLTILAPIQLTLGAVIPNLSFGSWVKSYISNLAVFVVTGALILFSFIFVSMGVQIGFESGIVEWLFGSGATGSIPGLLGQAFSDNINAWPPLLGVGGNPGVGLLFVMVSFVIFTMIPKANEMIQAFLSGKPFAYGTAISEAAAPLSAAWGFYGAPRLKGLQESTGRKFAEQDVGNIITKLNEIGQRMGITKPKSK